MRSYFSLKKKHDTVDRALLKRRRGGGGGRGYHRRRYFRHPTNNFHDGWEESFGVQSDDGAQGLTTKGSALRYCIIPTAVSMFQNLRCRASLLLVLQRFLPTSLWRMNADSKDKTIFATVPDI